MFPRECFKYVGDFGVVVFGVSVGVLTVLVDDFVGFLEDFGARCGLILGCGCHGFIFVLLGWLSIVGSCRRV